VPCSLLEHRTEHVLEAPLPDLDLDAISGNVEFRDLLAQPFNAIRSALDEDVYDLFRDLVLVRVLEERLQHHNRRAVLAVDIRARAGEAVDEDDSLTPASAEPCPRDHREPAVKVLAQDDVLAR
jgi:hypothetical protein